MLGVKSPKTWAGKGFDTKIHSPTALNFGQNSYILFLLNIFLILPKVWREKCLCLDSPEAP